MWYTEPSKPLNLQKVQESPIRGGIIEESINDTNKWEAERMARNILVVEDDRNISDLIRMYLEKEGFEVRSAYDGGKAVEEFDKQAPDMVLLDIMLPGIYGYELMDYAKASEIPVIFLTASSDESTVVSGFDMAADDYVAKPFRPRELVSRIRSVLRRCGRDKAVVTLGDVQADIERGQVTKNGADVYLTALEYRLLLVFVINRGKVLSRSRLLEEIWDVAGDFVNDNTLTVYIKRLREKIETDPAAPQIIRTVRGLGYRVEL